MTDQLAITDAIDAGLLSHAEHAALLFHLGSHKLRSTHELLALVDDLFFQADFEADPATGGLDERERLQLRGACRLVAHHLEQQQ